MTEFVPFTIPEVKLCADCQAATDAANPFPTEPGDLSVFKNEDDVWGYTFKPYGSAA